MLSVNLKILTFNVSGCPDLIETASKLKNAKSTSIQEKIRTIDGLPTFVGDDHIKIYKDMMEPYFLKLLQEQRPDVLCLQEMSKKASLDKSEHQCIQKVLEEKGYELSLKQDATVAYKKNRFELIKDGVTREQDYAQYADLRMIPENIIIRVVSDHPPFSQDGSGILKENLNSVDIKKDTFFQGLWQTMLSVFKKNTSPSLIIYGLDANATRENKNKALEWQPERLEIFYKNGYKTDEDDNNPTYKYQETAQKIDHIFFKALKGNLTKFKSEIDIELNGEKILEEPQEFPVSDHLPVIYNIEYGPPKTTFYSIVDYLS